MFEEINKELEALKKGMQRYEEISAMLGNLMNRQKELEEKNNDLLRGLEKEEEDVEDLNRKSLTSLLHTVLGDKNEQMEKEYKEALDARKKLEDNLKQMEETRFHITELSKERISYVNNETRYNDLYKKKYNLLKESSCEESQRIMELEENITLFKTNQKEIKEAITAGQRVLDQVNSAESNLDSAKGWGTWDILGGGFVTDMIKHSHIDDAEDAISHIQSLLDDFKTELADIKINSNLYINIGSFAKFADFFFDGLISDWVIQSKINDSLESVRNVKYEVNSVLNKLENFHAEIENSIAECSRRLTNLIETA